TFSEKLEAGFSGAELVDKAEKPVAAAVAIDGDTITLTTPDLKPGPYQVRWHSVGDDTHRMEGSVQFTVQPVRNADGGGGAGKGGLFRPDDADVRRHRAAPDDPRPSTPYRAARARWPAGQRPARRGACLPCVVRAGCGADGRHHAGQRRPDKRVGNPVRHRLSP